MFQLAEMVENRSRQKFEILSSVDFFRFRMAASSDDSDKFSRGLPQAILLAVSIDATSRFYIATFRRPTSKSPPLTFQFQSATRSESGDMPWLLLSSNDCDKMPLT